ncbi:MAG: ACP S-malonyltransferase [Lachnospiraceae bacterium]|nr:ACP S-malonyltransferase [Lachnospiraceae bacterium]
MGIALMVNKEIVFLFSGHGTQYYHMGHILYETNEQYRRLMDFQDEIIRKLSGRSVIEELYGKKNRKSDSFTDIRYTHPALFMVQYALAKSVIAEGITPDYVIGTSLGEYVAMAVAEILPLEKMLEFLLIQADLLYNDSSNGGMLSIFGDVENYRNTAMFKHVEIAAVNSCKHFVVSGKVEHLKEIEKGLARKVLYTRLDILYSFHSSSMDAYEDKFDRFYRDMKFAEPAIRVISCARCGEIKTIGKDYLMSIARDQIQFLETIRMHENNGNYLYIDLSPSGSLTNFLHDILNKEKWAYCYRVMSPYDKEENRQYIEMIQRLNKDKRERNYKMKAIIFAGQGSQRKGMGKDLFDQFPELVEKADEILGYSIKELCLENSDNRLESTEYAQPAIYVVNTLAYYKLKQNGICADYYAGHSLGEYNALLVAGVFSFEDGLKLVKKRGQLMGREKAGGMAAVIGLHKEEILKIMDKYNITSLDFANYNSPKQLVIAGPKEGLSVLAEAITKEETGKCIHLKVSGAFHSRYMTDARKNFAEFLREMKLEVPECKVIANYTALPYEKDRIYELMEAQINSSVKWKESVEYMLDHGVEEFTEIGQANILTKLVNEIKEDYVPRTPPTPQTPPALKTPPAHKKNLELLYGREFIEEYDISYPYVIGGMYQGISSVEMVVRGAKAGMLAFFGTGGLRYDEIRQAIKEIQKHVSKGAGMNFTPDYFNEEHNDKMVDTFLTCGVDIVEVSGTVRMFPALVRYRLNGLLPGEDGAVIVKNKIIAKLSRPEIAELFLKPAPEDIINKLLEQGKITGLEAELGRKIAMADDICVEQDSGGHTDQGSALVIFPTLRQMAQDYCKKFQYKKKIRVGLGGGIGTPEAMAAAFFIGAQFVVTGSINQCTVEAGISELSKEMLADANIQDTDYAPAGDMFEIGAKVQVLKKGVFFPARANRLYEAYKFYDSINSFDPKLREQMEKFYFGKSLNEVYKEIEEYYIEKNPDEIQRAQNNEKYKMALIFKQYFRYATQAAIKGDTANKANFQILCGSSMGAFNQWINNTVYRDYSKRHVDEIGFRLLEETENYITKRRY